MIADYNDGTWMDKKVFQFQVESGIRGDTDYEVFYVNDFMQCTCGLTNCRHINAVREMVSQDTEEVDDTYDVFLMGTGRI